MVDKTKTKSKKKKRIRIVPIKEVRYVKAVPLLPKEVVSELLRSIKTPLS